MIGPYATPDAFRMALEDRLRNAARAQGADLQRQRTKVAFDRLLARLFSVDNPPWLLKGGYALELRLAGRARSTVDLDFSVPNPDGLLLSGEFREGISPQEAAYESVQQATDRDLEDGFEFKIAREQEDLSGAPRAGFRCTVDARLAGRSFVRFHLDVGLGDAVLDSPDWIQGGQFLSFAGIAEPRIAVYPLAQQAAEKVHAYTFPWQDRDNTRVKDLVDLVLLVDSGQLDPERVRQALEATFRTRGTHALPETLPAPPADWAGPYADMAQALRLSVLTSSEACQFLDTWWRQWRLGLVDDSET